jgi:DNA-binding GntR family transcriptional regulator
MHNAYLIMLNLYFPQNIYKGNKKNLAEESIRTAILLGDVRPGYQITEQAVKNFLKISSSPVREAINQLEAEGLLTRKENGRVIVTEMDVEDAKELYSIQSLIQGTAVQICAKKISEADIFEAEKINSEMKNMLKGKIDVKGLRVLNYKLHMILCGINIYPWLTRLISSLWVRFPNQTVFQQLKYAKISIQEHEKIIEAVKKRNENLAGSSMKEHLEHAAKNIFRNIL